LAETVFADFPKKRAVHLAVEFCLRNLKFVMSRDDTPSVRQTKLHTQLVGKHEIEDVLFTDVRAAMLCKGQFVTGGTDSASYNTEADQDMKKEISQNASYH
jgi:hypothetical protein